MARGWTGRMPGSKFQPDVEAYGCPEPACYYYVRYRPGVEVHQCPQRGHSTYSWSETVKLVSEIWGYLDEEVDIFKNEEATEEERNMAGVRARAHCRTLLLFMRPIFHSEDEIVKESIKRWKARQAGEEHETPGLLHATYKTLTDGDPWYKAADGGWTNDPKFAVSPPAMYPDAVKNRVDGAVERFKETYPKQASEMGLVVKPVVTHDLSDQKVQAIRDFHSKGMTVPDLAMMTKVSVEVIQSIIA